MTVPEATSRHYARQQRLTVATVRATRREWDRLVVGDFDAAWRRVGPRLLTLVSSMQAGAARDGADYVTRVLDELEIDGTAVADVNPTAFAGIASDGRELESLLYEPVIRTKSQLAAGASLTEAAQSGRSTLDMIVQTQLADAGRAAAHAAMFSRPAVTRYVRMLQAPSCGRCAVLAGRVYRLNAAFQRHPRCDCRAIPATENIAKDFTTDTDAYFGSLSKADQDRYFGKAGAEAIRDGADIGQVVNARRKGAVYSADGHEFTHSGTTRRGSAGKRLMAEGAETTRVLQARRTLANGETRSIYQTRVQRITPDTIYREARDREHAIELLRRHGYLS